jgi:hypothetical protein
MSPRAIRPPNKTYPDQRQNHRHKNTATEPVKPLRQIVISDKWALHRLTVSRFLFLSSRKMIGSQSRKLKAEMVKPVGLAYM